MVIDADAAHAPFGEHVRLDRQGFERRPVEFFQQLPAGAAEPTGDLVVRQATDKLQSKNFAHLAHGRSLCWHSVPPLDSQESGPELASRGTRHPGEIIPEQWARSSRNGGRNYPGTVGDIARNRHYEGDTLVIDTIGVRTDHPYAMVDLFGTPYSKSLHVVERYRLRDWDDVKDAVERGKKENWLPAGDIFSQHRGKFLQLHVTIEGGGGGRGFNISPVAGWSKGCEQRARGRINDCVCSDAIGALHANSYTCRDDAPRMRSSVSARYIVAAPSAAPTAPAQAARGQAIGHLLVVSQARRRRWQA